jgi:hypothetical protein
VTETSSSLPPAFYAAPATTRRAVADWWVLLHPPYTLWHLAYVAIGAALAPHFDGVRLVATLLAFFLAVGVCAHALDELHGRPLRTAIPWWLLVVAAALSLAGAVVVGVAGIGRVGPGLLVFIAVGAAITCAYNLELLGGRLHNDMTFALAWGAFPVLTAYYAQADALGLPAYIGAIGAFALSSAQRALSAPARQLRRRTADIEGTITDVDGTRSPVTVEVLLEPLERALRAMTAGIVAIAAALVAYRIAHA